jgi:hypothetical protein
MFQMFSVILSLKMYRIFKSGWSLNGKWILKVDPAETGAGFDLILVLLITVPVATVLT